MLIQSQKPLNAISYTWSPIRVFRSKFYVSYRDEERPQQMIRQGRTVEKECLDLKSALGIELCGEITVPVLAKDKVARFPFTGPASGSVYINKKDTFTKYHVGGSFEVTKVSKRNIWE